MMLTMQFYFCDQLKILVSEKLCMYIRIHSSLYSATHYVVVKSMYVRTLWGSFEFLTPSMWSMPQSCVLQPSPSPISLFTYLPHTCKSTILLYLPPTDQHYVILAYYDVIGQGILNDFVYIHAIAWVTVHLQCTSPSPCLCICSQQLLGISLILNQPHLL